MVKVQGWITDLLGFQSATQFGAQQVQLQNHEGPDVDCSAFLAPKPSGFETTSLVMVKNWFNVVPTDWFSGGIVKPWYSIETHDSLSKCMTTMKDASFAAFDSGFLDFIGRGAKLEKIHSFSGVDADHVHEAPVYNPSTKELIFADTSVIGWLWALDVNSHKIRKIKTSPPLENVNGATMHDSKVWFTTNGGRAPGIWSCTIPKGVAKSDTSVETISCTPIVNNFRLHHFNSPNDLIFSSTGNILFTDPTYGWVQAWPGVGPPELATMTYHLNMKTRALTALDDSVLQPNGLVLSYDEKTMYIAESNSTSGKPVQTWEDSVRNVYAFDFDEFSLSLKNRRLVHVVESGWPDGLRLTRIGKIGIERELLLVACMGGVDLVDVSNRGAGVFLGKFNVGDDIVFNLEAAVEKDQNGKPRNAAGPWLFTGKKGVYKLTISPLS